MFRTIATETIGRHGIHQQGQDDRSRAIDHGVPQSPAMQQKNLHDGIHILPQEGRTNFVFVAKELKLYRIAQGSGSPLLFSPYEIQTLNRQRFDRDFITLPIRGVAPTLQPGIPLRSQSSGILS